MACAHPKAVGATCGAVTLRLLRGVPNTVVRVDGTNWVPYVILADGFSVDFPGPITLHRMAKKHLGRRYRTYERKQYSGKLFCYLEAGTTPEGRAAFLGAVCAYTKTIRAHPG